MAIYHCHCKIIGRSNGRSAVGAAAYRSGEKLENEYDGMTHDYRKKSGVVYSEIMLCENAPKQYLDRQTFWNAVENVEKGSRAQLAREFEVALPKELSREEQIQLVREYTKNNFVNQGMCADFSIHDKKDGNPHAHIMLTTRGINEKGEWKPKEIKDYVRDENGERVPIIDKKTGQQKVDSRNRKQWERKYIQTNEWNNPEFLKQSRENWAESINRSLEKKNIPQRVDHRSFKEQGKEQIPTQHIGVSAIAMERRGIQSDRGNENRAIKQENARAAQLDKAIAETKKEISYIRDDIRWNKIHERNQSLSNILENGQHTEASLKEIQRRLNNIYEQVKAEKPSVASEGRTEGNKAYHDYHKDKALSDIKEMQNNVSGYLKFIKQQKEKPMVAEPQEKATPVPSRVEIEEARKINDNNIAAWHKVYPNISESTIRKHAEIATKDGTVLIIRSPNKNGKYELRYYSIEDYKKLSNLAKLHEPPQEKVIPDPPAPSRATPVIETPKTTVFDSDRAAKQLAEYRNDFVKAFIQSGKPTTYQENTIYSQQANQISEFSERIQEQTDTIKQFTAERDKLGLFDRKKKKVLNEKINEFISLRRDNLEKLEALGVSDPAQAEKVRQDKLDLAADEKAKVKEAKENVGAESRVAEAKNKFLEYAETIPADQRQAVLSKIGDYKYKGNKTMADNKAEIQAQKQLDIALTDKSQEKSRQHDRDHDRGHDR